MKELLLRDEVVAGATIADVRDAIIRDDVVIHLAHRHQSRAGSVNPGEVDLGADRMRIHEDHETPADRTLGNDESAMPVLAMSRLQDQNEGKSTTGGNASCRLQSHDHLGSDGQFLTRLDGDQLVGRQGMMPLAHKKCLQKGGVVPVRPKLLSLGSGFLMYHDFKNNVNNKIRPRYILVLFYSMYYINLF